MYSSSASPRTSRPARSQLFRSHDQRSPRTAHPLSRSLSPPASPRSCPCLCTERRRNNHSASPRAQPHADATPRAPPNERVLPRQILQRLTVWPPILAFTGHDPGRHVILPAQLLLMSLHGPPVQRSLSITRAHNRQTPAMRRGLALAATPKQLFWSRFQGHVDSTAFSSLNFFSTPSPPSSDLARQLHSFSSHATAATAATQ